MLLSVTLILEVLTLLYILKIVWRMSKKPGSAKRSILVGWFLSFCWAVFWALLIPMSMTSFLSPKEIAKTFPEGTAVVAFLVLGWFWPAVTVALASVFRRRAISKQQSPL
jgi:uncharacterized membrane protein